MTNVKWQQFFQGPLTLTSNSPTAINRTPFLWQSSPAALSTTSHTAPSLSRPTLRTDHTMIACVTSMSTAQQAGQVVIAWWSSIVRGLKDSEWPRNLYCLSQ